MNSKADKRTNEVTNQKIAIVFPSGALKISESERLERISALSECGLNLKLFEPESVSTDGYSAGETLERAILFSQALTLRQFPVLWAGKGGFGSTTLLATLENLLPPVLPDKTFFGYSDASFIGFILSLKYQNFTYIMGGNAFEPDLLNRFDSQGKRDLRLTLELLKGGIPNPIQLDTSYAYSPFQNSKEISGIVTPLNLSLAESASCLQGLRLPKGRILFIEDVNEDLFRVLRKVDSLSNSGFLANTEAIVLGEFINCPKSNKSETAPAELANLIGQRTGLPVFVFPHFGHANRRLPLVNGSRVEFHPNGSGNWTATLGFERIKWLKTGPFQTGRMVPAQRTNNQGHKKVHFFGIGGTGMTAVAGLAKKAGFEVTGSDGPIYPPMSHVLEDLQITPFKKYSAQNIVDANPDLIVLANAISRIDSALNRNAEFEYLIQNHIPTMSFPGFLREFFLKDSLNIVVAGTHGKTTTTSAVCHSLRELKFDPSFLIGGAPKNFDQGFFLGKSNLFVLCIFEPKTESILP